MHSTSVFMSTLALGLLFLTSCGVEKVPGYIRTFGQSSPLALNMNLPSNNFRIIITDDPFTYDLVMKATLTIDKIDLVDNDGNSKAVLSKKNSVELVSLRNGKARVLTEASVPLGQKYNQLKVFFSSASIDLRDGRHFDLDIPATAASGVLIPISPSMDIKTGAVTELLVDVDLSRSFLPNGDLSKTEGVTGFTFFPVMRTADVAQAGVFNGVVYTNNGTPLQKDDKALTGAVIELTRGSSSFTAISEADGTYQFIGVTEGKYSFVTKAHDHKDSLPVEIEVLKSQAVTSSTLLIKE